MQKGWFIKMTTFKKAIAIVSVLLIVLFMLPVSVFAADSGDFSYTVNADKTTCTLTGYSGSEMELAIPETIDGYSVTALGEALFIFAKGPESIVIPKTVLSVNKTAFYFSTIIKNVTVAEENPMFSSMDGVLFNKAKTELLYFPVAKAVESYVIPEGVTVIAENAFRKTAVPSITLPSTLKIIGASAFDTNRVLREIVIPKGTVSIGASAFRNCDMLKTASLPDSVTDLGTGVFYQCGALEQIRLPNGLQTIPASMFLKCTSLKEIVIPGSVTEIGMQAFYRCDALEKIVIPENVVSIGSNAFVRGTNSVPLTICSVEGSYAYTYALENGIAFIDLNAPVVLTPGNNTGDTMIKTSALTENGESAERFTVTIPAETVIPWGASSKDMLYSVESHLSYQKALSVTVSGHGVMTYTPDADVTLTLPYTLTGETAFTGDRPTIYPASEKIITVHISDDAWNNAPIAEYSDVLTFTAEVI